MKFFCEYCGNRIDAEIDHKCPHCGASYKKNKSFLKLQEEQKQREKIVTENSQKVFKTVFGVFAFSKFLMIMPIIIFIIIITIVFKSVNKQMDIEQNIKDEINELNKKEDEKITVGFNEYAETSEYKVKVTKYEVVEDKFNRLDDSYEYIKFHLVVENISNKELTKEDVYCIVDGVSQTNDLSSGYSNLPMFIAKDLAVTGTATFEIPKGTTSFDIRYGDNVTIHIEK